MRKLFRFRLATLFLATAIIAVTTYYINWRYFTPDGVYQTTKNGYALLGILGVEIRNGDTLAAVQRRLGKGTPVSDKEWLTQKQSDVESNETIATDGYKDTDTFVTYSSAEGFAVDLQFRNQILINFHIPESARTTMIDHYTTCTQISKRKANSSNGPIPTLAPATMAQ